MKLKIILGSLFLLVGCKTINNTTNETIYEKVSIEHTYSEIQKYEIKWDEMFGVERTDYYIYFYSLSCSHCEDLKNFIIETAQKQERDGL